MPLIYRKTAPSAMDRLSQEIIDRIAAMLPEEPQKMEQPLAPAATASKRRNRISRLMSKMRLTDGQQAANAQEATPSEPQDQYWTRAAVANLNHRWQRAVEPAIFSKLSLSSSKSDVDFLSSVLARRPERERFLRSIVVMTSLKHEHYTYIGGKNLLNSLFTALGALRNAKAVDLVLRFEAGHPDLRHQARDGIVFDRVHSEPLTEVPCVRKLDFTPVTLDTEKKRRDILQLQPMEQVFLVHYFPNLQAVAWHFVETEQQFVRDTTRDTFSEYMERILRERPKLTSVSVSLSVGRLGTRILSPAGIGAESYNRLYARLRASTAHVTDLSYSGILGPSFLQPNDGDGDGDGEGERLWPSLRNLTVCMALLTQNGQWAFDGDAFSLVELDTPLEWQPEFATLQKGQHSGFYDDRPFWFRELPDEEGMVPLLEAFAALIARLPVLQTAQLIARRGAGKAAPWAVVYCAPGKTSRWIDYSQLDIEKPRVWFVTGRWQPAEELVQRFRNAGSGARHGDVSIMYWSILDAPVTI